MPREPLRRPDPARTGLPDLIRPMLATAGTLPPPADEAAWAFEMKWDGVRAVAYVWDGRLVRLLTRNDREVAGTYPELSGLGSALRGRSAVLDGEVVAFNPTGRPSFGALQSRMHVAAPTAALRREVPVDYLAFDLLWLDGEALVERSYDERREALEGLAVDGERWHTPPVFHGDGDAALRTSRAQALEGVLAKRRGAPYEPGRRSRSWLKVKNVRHQEVVVGGWKPGEGNRTGGIGSLLLGIPDGAGDLCFVGHVGSGFTAAMLRDLAARLAPLERATSPFAPAVPREHARDAHWVEPVLVAEVAYGDWTRDGRLRHPVWRGLRADRDVTSVRRGEG